MRDPAPIGEISEDQHMIVICHLGQRGPRVATWLRSRGFDKVTSPGGSDAWTREGDTAIGRN